MPATGTKTRTRKASHSRKARPTSKQQSALLPIVCACGCQESFVPTRKDQKFLAQHRFRTYKTHKCPSCGIVHREGVAK